MKDMEEAMGKVEQLALASAVRGSNPSRAPKAMPALAVEASESDVMHFHELCNQILKKMKLPSQSCEDFRAFFEFQRARKGTVLWDVGDDSDFAFLLVSGVAGVCSSAFSDETDEDFIEMCNAGIFVGELNLFTGETRKHKLVVLEEVSIWTITRESLLQMQDKALSLAFVFQSIAMRYAGHRMNLSMLDGKAHSV